jgi:small subunit ribosomal protein S9
MSTITTVGRRKTAVARVIFSPGSGGFQINHREKNNYLNNEVLRIKAQQPFDLLGLRPDGFDVRVNVDGGGVNGQAEAIRLGIARALVLYNPEYRPALKKEGLLTVDSRQVERKKYGHKKARKSFQFSKR